MFGCVGFVISCAASSDGDDAAGGGSGGAAGGSSAPPVGGGGVSGQGTSGVTGDSGDDAGGSAGAAGGALDLDCAAQESRCTVDGVFEVCRSGSWVKDSDCRDPGLCSTRRGCLNCAPGSFQCQKETLAQCSLDGMAWELVRTCKGADACFVDGEIGSCRLCEAKRSVCESVQRQYPSSLSSEPGRSSTNLRTCNSFGSGTIADQVCGSETPICDADNDRCLSCAPNQVVCDEGMLRRCNAEGTAFDLVEDCGDVALCDAASVSCKRAGCRQTSGATAAPGAVVCDKSALSVCRNDGKWDVLDICESDGACAAGLSLRVCLDTASDGCVPGSSACAGDSLLHCAPANDGTLSAPRAGTWYTYARCAGSCVESEGSATCAATATYAAPYHQGIACEAGSSKYSICSASGCTDAVCASGEVCAGADAGCLTCVPGALRCDSYRNTLLRCNQSGAAESLLEDCGAGVCDGYRGQCLPAAVGERYCQAGQLFRVAVDGSNQLIQDCGAQELCDAETGCRAAPCVASSLSCGGKTGADVYQCSNGILLRATGRRCESAERCEEGLGCAGAVRIAAGEAHTCALVTSLEQPSSSGYVKCWGANEAGQLGNGSELLSNEPELRPVVSRLNGEQNTISPIFRDTGLCAGKNFSCADIDLVGGGVGVACWGANDHGQLGIGTKNTTVSYENTPTSYNYIEQAVSKAGDGSNAAALAPFVGLHQVSCGADFACAIANGAAFCWGSNDTGQLGIGQSSSAYSSLPVPVAGLSEVRSLWLGARHACAITDSGSVYCWGDGSKNQLGLGKTQTMVSPSPTAVGELAAKGLALGRDFSLALTSDGVWAWGQNLFGQLSTGNSTGSAVPVAAAALAGSDTGLIVASALGGHACAVRGDSLWCWGANPLGELGDGSNTDRYEPVRVIDSKVQAVPGAVALGKSHSCAIDATNGIWCWGGNGRAQLGLGFVQRKMPSPERVY